MNLSEKIFTKKELLESSILGNIQQSVSNPNDFVINGKHFVTFTVDMKKGINVLLKRYGLEFSTAPHGKYIDCYVVTSLGTGLISKFNISFIENTNKVVIDKISNDIPQFVLMLFKEYFRDELGLYIY